MKALSYLTLCPNFSWIQQRLLLKILEYPDHDLTPNLLVRVGWLSRTYWNIFDFVLSTRHHKSQIFLFSSAWELVLQPPPSPWFYGKQNPRWVLSCQEKMTWKGKMRAQRWRQGYENRVCVTRGQQPESQSTIWDATSKRNKGQPDNISQIH